MSVNRESFGRISEADNPPLEYYDLVRTLNTILQHELSDKLGDSLSHIPGVAAYVTTGSDARLEKGSFASPLEIIALVNEDVDIDVLRTTIADSLHKQFPGQISKVVEVKGLTSSMVNFQDDPKRKQPGRIADSRLIAGDQQAVIDAKQRLGDEIVAMPSKELDKIAGLARDARNATERGRNRIAGEDVVHFDLETGVVFYNPDARQQSFKIGPLRLVQNKLLIEEVRHVRREKDTAFFTRVLSSVRHRLSQFKDEKLLDMSRSTIRELQDHYAYFLRLYHRSEQHYIHTNNPAIQLTPNEIQEVARRLQAMTEITERLKLQKTS